MIVSFFFVGKNKKMTDNEKKNIEKKIYFEE